MNRYRVQGEAHVYSEGSAGTVGIDPIVFDYWIEADTEATALAGAKILADQEIFEALINRADLGTEWPKPLHVVKRH